jgi:hypothetical protein
MGRLCAWAVMALALSPMAASAQVAPPPGFHELELAIIIARAGYDCPVVESFEVTTNPMPGWESLRPEVAICQNGKRYLIAHSGRRGADARPVVRPLPAPAKE